MVVPCPGAGLLRCGPVRVNRQDSDLHRCLTVRKEVLNNRSLNVPLFVDVFVSVESGPDGVSSFAYILYITNST